MFRWLRWHLAKRRLTAWPSNWPPPHLTVSVTIHEKKLEDLPPDEPAYGHLAALWDEYAGGSAPGYGAFLQSAGAYYRSPANAVLDLACGTGLLTRQIATRAESVVGLDVSNDMLREARQRTSETNVRYVEGDFRDFSLPETFDAAVCGGDSLNYVNTPGELADVFRCVRRHLRPGGLFVFDVLEHSHFLQTASIGLLVEAGEEWFEKYNFYDPETRVSEPRIVFKDAVERHRRIPIEEGDVVRSCTAAGLEPVEHFSRETYRPFSYSVERQFYVLRVPQL